MILGLDTSRWEDNPATVETISWKTAKLAGVQFVIMKATEGGTYTDPVFALHKQNLAGILPRGSYHYWRPAISAKVQAAHYFAVAGNLELPPILDVEGFYGDLPIGARLVSAVLEMMAEIDKLFSKPCMLYTAPNIVRSMAITASSPLCKRKLWIANYGVKTPLVSPWVKYTFWQYTDREPAVKYGISEATSVDANWYDGTVDEFNAEFGIGVAVPTPEPEPVPVPEDPGLEPEPVPVAVSGLYTFSKTNYFSRRGGGPLTLPMTRSRGKLGDNISRYPWWILAVILRALNSENKAAVDLISAPDWGPSKGLDGDDIKWIGLLWPGRNIVRVAEIVDGWGRVEGSDMYESGNYNALDHPDKVHKVYDYHATNGWCDRAKPVYVPILGGGWWVDMQNLVSVDSQLPKKVTVTCFPALVIREKPSISSAIMGRKINMQTMTVLEVVTGIGGLWGRIAEGWVALRYQDKNMTDWKI